jgi:DnaJ-domain-containing protein 1
VARKREHVVEILGAPKMRDGLRLCDAPGCEETGDFRAPRSRDHLDNYYWFCMEHVRAYNARWNFYAGMSQAEIEKQIRADTTWWRPTWPLGSRGGRRDRIRPDQPEIDLGIFGDEDWDRERIRSGHVNGSGWRPRPGSDEAEALAVLDLDAPVTRDEVKARYKTLVKRHHPDANGGNRDAEERLKVINRAYSVLRANTEF